MIKPTPKILPRLFAKAIIAISLVFTLPIANAQDYAKVLAPITFESTQDIQEATNQYINNNLFHSWQGYENGNILKLNQFLNYEVDSSVYQSNIELLELRSKTAKADLGFSLSGSYLHNFNQTAIIDVDDVPYSNRGQIGLKWDLLQNGLIGNRLKAQTFENELALEKESFISSTKKFAYPYLYNRFIQSFNQHKLLNLQLLEQALEMQVSINEYLHAENEITYQQTIHVRGKLENTRQLMKMYDNYNDEMVEMTGSSVNFTQFPVVSLNLDAIANSTLYNEPTEERQELMRTQLNLKNHPLNDINLSANVRYNYVNGIDQTAFINNNNTREYASAGINFTVPLSILTSRKKKLVETQLHKELMQADFQVYNSRKEILNHYYEHQYNLKQFIQAYFKLADVQEQIRQEYAKRVDHYDYSPVKLLDLLITYYEIKLVLIEIHEKMYLKLLKVYSYLEDESVERIVTKVNLNEYLPSGKIDGLYIWSKDFMTFDNDFITEYLSAIKAKELHLSLGNFSQQASENIVSFNEKTKQRGIQTSRLVGNNKLLYTENHSQLEGLFLESKALGFNEIHLDVEPHALKTWPNEDTTLMDQYLVMLQKASQLSIQHHTKLSVSIPVFYETDILEKIYPLVDKVYVMAYQKPNISNLIKYLKEEVAIDDVKTNIALSADLFKDIRTLGIYAQKVKSQFPKSSIIMHDFGKMISLEKATLYKTAP